MGELKTPKKTLEKLAEIEREKEAYTAVVGAIDLMENYYKYLEKAPMKYDKNTGDPKKFRWLPHKKFEKVIPVGYDILKKRYLAKNVLVEGIQLNDRVITYLFERLNIKEVPLIVNTQFGKYALKYYEEACGDTTLREILFIPLKKTLTKKGLEEVV